MPAGHRAPARQWLRGLAPVFRLTRVTTAFAAVGNAWFVILWSRANASGPELLREPGTAALRDESLTLLLSAGGLSALGLYAYGAALNDVIDARRDRGLAPARPIAAGALSNDAAIVIVVMALLASVLGATALGPRAVLVTLAVALAILLFNVAGKFIPALGLVILGLIYAGQMLAPNVHLRFIWPVWLVMTHALAVGALTYTMARKTPRVSRRAWAAAATGWLFWSGVVLVLPLRFEDGTLWPDWVAPAAAIGPTLLVPAFGLLAARRVAAHGWSPRAAEKITRYGALWLSLYGVGWLAGQGHLKETLILGALSASGFLGMTVLRELYHLVEQPVGYRR